MLDPLPNRAFPILSHLADKVSPYLGFNTLHLHIHQVLLSAVAYHFICLVLSPAISSRLFPEKYSKLPWRTKLNWDIHVVSLIQSTLISIAALWVIFNDRERAEMDFRGRVWGYTGAAGMVQSLAAGYFLWDLWVSSVHIDIFGLGMLAHAVSALAVYMLGYRPFVNYYAPAFILYELSSPFLNFHWFFDKLEMTGSTAQLINGIVLMSTFFGCRLVYGTYETIRVFGDIWQAMQYQSTAEGRAWLDGRALAASSLGDKASTELWRYSYGATLPLWLASVYVISNGTLIALNIYWFAKMVATIRRRFDPPFGTKKPEAKKQVVMGRGLYDEVIKTVEIDSTEVRRRGAAKTSDHPPPN